MSLPEPPASSTALTIEEAETAAAPSGNTGWLPLNDRLLAAPQFANRRHISGRP